MCAHATLPRPRRSHAPRAAAWHTEGGALAPQVAPEILDMSVHGGYDEQVDVWSMGVILYILLCGFPPFYGEEEAMFDKIKAGDFAFLMPQWEPISQGARDVVSRMLVVDPRKRARIDELLRDPWLAPKAADAPANPEEFDLAHAPTYHLKETEQALALQTKAARLFFASIRITKHVRKLRKRMQEKAAKAADDGAKYVAATSTTSAADGLARTESFEVVRTQSFLARQAAESAKAKPSRSCECGGFDQAAWYSFLCVARG